MINRPSLLAASAIECRRHNWHKAGKVTLQFSGICNCGLSIWRTTYGGLSPRCPDIEFKVARVSVSKGTVWTCALHWNSQTLRLICTQATTQSKNGGYKQNTNAIFSLFMNYADVLLNSYYGLFTETVRSGLPIELHHPTSKNSSSVSMVSVMCCDRISTYLRPHTINKLTQRQSMTSTGS